MSKLLIKALQLLFNPKSLAISFIYHTAKLWSDETYLRIMFRLKMGKQLNLNTPQSFSEKLQWMKLYDRRPEYTIMVDKVKVKDYVSSIIGTDYVIPTLGVWEDPDEIDFSKLPNRFVLKVNHNSGTGMFICKDKTKMDVEKVKAELRKGLKEDYYLVNREWPYKNVPRRILAEQYIDPLPKDKDLKDYKLFCFDGKVKALFIATDRSKGEHEVKFDFFDEQFNHLPLTNGHPNAPTLPKRPETFEKMKELAAKLSKGLPQVRIDFYDVNGHVFFGEMTLFHWSGLMPYVPEEWDYKFGEWYKLPKDGIDL